MQDNTLLEKNLRAIAEANVDLFQRICLPVDDSHVSLSGNHAFYMYRRNPFPLSIDDRILQETTAAVKPAQTVFLFGFGLGELLNFVLDRYPESDVIAWERDPWLLRMVLSRYSYANHIQQNKIHFALGVDLLRYLNAVVSCHVIVHPLMGKIYRDERNILTGGVKNSRALICEGELFVDDLSSELQKQGYSTYRMNTRSLSIEEMALTVKRFQPQLIASINYQNGMAEFCHHNHIPLLCWEIDPVLDMLKPLEAPSKSTYIFTYRKANAQAFKAAGFQQAEYLPLATNPERRKPTPLFQRDEERYAAPISFVGMSMKDQAQKNRSIFITQYQAYQQQAPGQVPVASDILTDLLDEQALDYSIFIIPQGISEKLPDFVKFRQKMKYPEDLTILISEIAAHEKRVNYLKALGHHRICVWGDEGFKCIESSGAHYSGLAKHWSDLNKIYSNSRINIDIGRLYQQDIVTMRIFDIIACGGFVLAEWNDALSEMFIINEEIESYRHLDELQDKVTYYLRHPKKAQNIVRKGRERVLTDHTISSRLSYMLKAILPSS